jgi:hypothetical protein
MREYHGVETVLTHFSQREIAAANVCWSAIPPLAGSKRRQLTDVLRSETDRGSMRNGG